jgi:hypothetical protein
MVYRLEDRPSATGSAVRRLRPGRQVLPEDIELGGVPANLVEEVA